MKLPKLKNADTGLVAVYGMGKAMPCRRTFTYGLRLKICIAGDAGDYLGAVTRVDRRILIAVEYNSGLRGQGRATVHLISSATHRGEGGRDIMGGAASKS